MKKYLSLLLALTLCLCTVCGALADTADGAVNTVSKSKTATNLDANLETTVTLSFPSEEVSLDSDVVFVLDKSTSADVEKAALEMLEELQEQLEGTSAHIKVGVVIFNYEAHNESEGLLDLATQYDKIKAAIETNRSSGTNTHAGLLKAKEMLDADTSVDASRKHLIFVSDGITYIFGENPTAVNTVYWNDGGKYTANDPEVWKKKYGNDNPPASGWNNYLTGIGTLLATQGKTYDYPYGTELDKRGVSQTDPDKPAEYANGIDKALYLTAEVYKECKDAGYNCYAVAIENEKTDRFLWGPSFMNYLAEGKALDFTKIEAKILYLLGAGSSVEDVIGNDFDLIPGSFQLTVGGVSYPAIRDGNHYYFGDKQYEVKYNPDGESFTFTINENVTNFKRVQLTYNLKVSNPETAPGTYGQYDRDGSKGYDGLHTNEKAELTPKDSAGNEGGTETFQKPTVSYTVNGAATSVPKTGDTSTPALWIALLTLSAAALFVLSRRRAA